MKYTQFGKFEISPFV